MMYMRRIRLDLLQMQVCDHQILAQLLEVPAQLSTVVLGAAAL